MKTKKILQKTVNKPQLLIDSGCGIYTPQVFAQSYNNAKNFTNYNPQLRDNLDSLSLPNSHMEDDYFEIWEEVLNNARMIIDEGEYYLYEIEDLWAVPVGYKDEEFFNL
jgi:hypothetical protein